MGKIRITGLVRAATTIRRELAGAVSAERFEELREEVSEYIRVVHGILAEHDEQVGALPTPSRKAYEFLRGIDFERIEPSDSASEEEYARSSVRLPGLKKFIEKMLDDLTLAEQPDLDVLHGRLCRSSRAVERQLQANRLEVKHLTEESRTLRGWLAYFSDRENFDAYAAAMERARPAFERAVQRSTRFHLPMWIHLRPMKGLYRVRSYSNGTRISMPTPMISFETGDFSMLAEIALAGRRDKQQVIEKTQGEKFRAIQAELEALTGVVEQTEGVVHDLTVSFDRVNATYFGNDVSRPRLTWSRTFSERKFGHYDPVHDTVMVSTSLDDTNVPEFVVDFIVYHELLHKKLGVRWNNGRMEVHTPEFQRKERLFQRFSEAEAVLNKLAKGL